MLEEILRTRVMVKTSMKAAPQAGPQKVGAPQAGPPPDAALLRLLHARQLSLKLIANVTFGYTAANYSGRMPNVEVGPPNPEPLTPNS